MINQNWVFGKNVRLKFPTPGTTGGTLSFDAASAMDAKEGCASISDANGNLLLYTDGRNVWDSANQSQASGLLGDSSSTQSGIIVPNRYHPGQYYVVTADGITGMNRHVAFTLIDTNTTSWVSSPADPDPLPPQQPQPPSPQNLQFSATEKVTAIQHANCKDFWVVTIVQEVASGQSESAPVGKGQGWLRVFLIDSTGVHHKRDQRLDREVYDVGYLKGSADGTWIAIANYLGKNVLLYHFDNFWGKVSIPGVMITVPAFQEPVDNHWAAPYGVEFSPKGRFLYFTVMGFRDASDISNGYVFRYDLTPPSTTTTPNPCEIWKHKNQLDGDEEGQPSVGALQLGVDNRIYIALPGEKQLGCITNPDELTANVIVTMVPFSSNPSTFSGQCREGLPNLIANACDFVCDEAVDNANNTLNLQASHKQFTVWAHGQVAPHECTPAFTETNFTPIFSLHWGDGPHDQFESHDTEIIYIRIRNPFNNLIFKGVRIFNIRVVTNQVIPGGENALQLIPSEVVCFDEIGPCSYVSRDFAFLIQHAIPNPYKIMFDYCIEEVAIVAANKGSAEFDITVVAS